MRRSDLLPLRPAAQRESERKLYDQARKMARESPLYLSAREALNFLRIENPISTQGPK